MKRILALLSVLLVCAACATGAGRAVALATTGLPPSVPRAIDGIESEYERLSAGELADIAAGNLVEEDGTVKPETVIKQEKFTQEFTARRTATRELFASLRLYLGAEKGLPATATQDAAAAAKAEAFDAVIARLRKALLEAKAKKADAK